MICLLVDFGGTKNHLKVISCFTMINEWTPSIFFRYYKFNVLNNEVTFHINYVELDARVIYSISFAIII